ncbi:MAG: LacI family DNA-binding transcriptional regulator [Propioniciclava sp.]
MAKITQVAARAGVSISTVSYALSGKRPVSAQTRKRVLEAARELGYQPNAGARMLAGRRTNIFGVSEPLRPDTHTPTHMAFVMAVAVAARQYDYDALLLTQAEATTGVSRVAASGLADAILVLDVAPEDPRVALAREVDMPVVFVGIPTDHEGLVCVDLDFEGAAERAVNRVADAGHTQIAVIGQTEAMMRTSNFPPRVQRGLEAAAQARGVSLQMWPSGAVQTEAAAVVAAVDAGLAAGATAFLLHCSEDAHAVARARLDEQGLQVPADVSLISVAVVPTEHHGIDSIPLLPDASSRLAVDLAYSAVEDGRMAPGVHLIEPVYWERGSVAPPPEI